MSCRHIAQRQDVARAFGFLPFQPQKTHARLQHAGAVAGGDQDIRAAIVIRIMFLGDQPFIGLRDRGHPQEPAHGTVQSQCLGASENVAACPL
jgi:hypothetical protein